LRPIDVAQRNLWLRQEGQAGVTEIRKADSFHVGWATVGWPHPGARFDPASIPQGKPVVLICQTGGRSARALRSALDAEEWMRGIIRAG
jgi:rhodanese-related sulfurtransferase